ncbi:hypothetical protein LTR62_001647 [Meristemomyces frigidus]|uniref:Uncharacterized protein n=1 Tax=Meristemomyces frigidus TaxID=1508187 RepID=A0AAN7T944_9PEZI|nr:hypothetical protein LTR62_001647 [Meristemomyces frigidus]
MGSQIRREPVQKQSTCSSEPEFHLLDTPLGTQIARVANDRIVASTRTSLAAPIAINPFPKMEFPAVRAAHNAGLNRLMVERNVSRYWRYAHIDGEKLPANFSELPTASKVIVTIVTCGLSFCFSTPAPPPPADSSAATFDRQRGYCYYLVPEIPFNGLEMHDDFGDQYMMSNYGAGTVSQDCFWLMGTGMKSVAPGDAWAGMPGGTAVNISWDWIWLYTYGEKSAVQKVPHGLTGNTTVHGARERLMQVERDTLQTLALGGFRGYAVAVWPPALINGVIVA